MWCYQYFVYAFILQYIHHVIPTSTSAPQYLKSHIPYGVQLDFSMTAKELDISSYSPNSITLVAIANNNFWCVLPNEELENGAANSTSSPILKSEKKRLKYSFPEMVEYLVSAKFAAISKKCFRFRKKMKWIYEFCFRKHFLMFDGSAGKQLVHGKDLFNLGTFDSRSEILSANGTVQQLYNNDRDNTSTKAEFHCSTSPFGITEFNELNDSYYIRFEGPMFCDFRDTHSLQPPLVSLLHDFQNWCTNFPANRWTYEYCHPDSLIQFYFDSTGSTEDEIFLLGTLPSSPVIINPTLHEMLTSYPMLRTPIRKKYGKKYKQFSDLSLDIVEMPPHFKELHGVRSYNALALNLTHGTYCADIMGPRTATVYFYCPGDFILQIQRRVKDTIEVSVCRYEIFIAATSVCPHPLLLPPLQPQVETIRCYPETHDTTSTTSHNFNDLPKTPHFVANDHLKRVGQDEVSSVSNFLKLEGIPSNITGYSSLQFAFGMGKYKRSHERLLRIPAYSVGQTVKHKWWGYTGVIVGWDGECIAPPWWIQKVYMEYPFEHQQWPHYAVLISQSYNATNEELLFAYLPEIALQPVGAIQIHHPYLESIFKRFDRLVNRWILHPSLSQFYQPEDLPTSDPQVSTECKEDCNSSDLLLLTSLHEEWNEQLRNSEEKAILSKRTAPAYEEL